MPAGNVQKRVYECLDPRGHMPQKVKTPLTAPRPTTIEGKNVLVSLAEGGYPNLMPEVLDELSRQLPGTNVVFWDTDTKGNIKVEQAKELKIDAVIAGVGF